MKWEERNKKSLYITRVYELMISLSGIDAIYSIHAMIEKFKEKLQEVVFRQEQYSVIQTDENKLKRKWGN